MRSERRTAVWLRGVPAVRLVPMRVLAAVALLSLACSRSERPDTVRLFVDDGGAGDLTPVVFIHSLAGHTGHWTNQLTHLRTTRRAIALDLRGHGRSPVPDDSDYSVPALARDVGDALDELRLERVILVGHSIGALVAIENAAAHPDVVAGVLLLDPAGDARKVPPEIMQGFFASMDTNYAGTIAEYWEGSLAGSQQSVRAAVMADLRATPRAAVEGALRALLAYDPVTPLTAYRGPARTINTRLNDDPSGLASLVPSLPVRRIEGTGHWLQLDKPDDVNREIDDFLTAVGR